MKSKKIIVSILALSACLLATAQPYSWERKYDGVHKNEIEGSLMGGNNILTGWFGGESCTYTRHLTDRWSIRAGEQVQLFKKLYSFDVMGTYRLPVGKTSNLYFDGRFLFNRYDRWVMNEPIFHLSAYWETPYVDLRVGASWVHYVKIGIDNTFTDAAYTEPIAVAVGFGMNIRPRSNPWNLGFFIRNYDQFYYENWNINWGVRFHTRITDTMKIFSEFNVRPAGSLSQLATRYETSLKIGLRYVL